MQSSGCVRRTLDGFDGLPTHRPPRAPKAQLGAAAYGAPKFASRTTGSSVERVFDASCLELSVPLVIRPPRGRDHRLPGRGLSRRHAEPVRWSQYVPGGLLADVLAQPADTAAEHREFEVLERIGGWE